MQKILIITAIIFTTISCSTIKEVETGGDWSGYDYSYFCPAYTFSEKGQTSEKWDILNANHISMASKDYKTALDTIENYLKGRGGLDFFNKVKLYDVDITYFEHANDFKNKSPLYDLEKCGETKYYFRFLFRGGKDIDYRFGIALNDKNEIISEHSIPNHNNNPHFSNIITPRKALKLAKQYNDSLVIPLESIELIYDKKSNCFAWDIDQEMKSPKTSGKVDYGFVKLNGETGEIIDSGKRTGRVHINHSW
jgi:hypothetical protein